MCLASNSQVRRNPALHSHSRMFVKDVNVCIVFKSDYQMNGENVQRTREYLRNILWYGDAVHSNVIAAIYLQPSTPLMNRENNIREFRCVSSLQSRKFLTVKIPTLWYLMIHDLFIYISFVSNCTGVFPNIKQLHY